jgi:hypothetical protein
MMLDVGAAVVASVDGPPFLEDLAVPTFNLVTLAVARLVIRYPKLLLDSLGQQASTGVLKPGQIGRPEQRSR